jgi:hypothetical protein
VQPYRNASSGWTFLHQAAYFGNEAASRELIRWGAKVNVQHHWDEAVTCHAAAGIPPHGSSQLAAAAVAVGVVDDFAAAVAVGVDADAVGVAAPVPEKLVVLHPAATAAMPSSRISRLRASGRRR